MAAGSAATPRLHVVFRSHGGENLKSRPGYYSKLLALTSFVRALEPVAGSCSVLFLNDGPIPAERVEVMRRAGRVGQASFGSNRRSYRAAVGLACRMPAADRDLVWFAEDDYLYRPDALERLLAAAAAVPGGDYFSLYSPADLDAGRSGTAPLPWPAGRPVDGGADDGGPDGPQVVVGGTLWFRAVSTTSTFGVRAGVLRQDARLLRAAPYTGGAWDHTTCVAVQGERPFTAAELRHDLVPFGAESLRAWPRSMVRGATHVAMNLRSARRPDRRRSLYACDPLLALHLETIEDGRVDDPGWTALADETLAWSQRHGLPTGTGRAAG